MRPAAAAGAAHAHGWTTHSTVSRGAPLATAGAGSLRASEREASLDATACLTPAHPALRLRRSVRVDGAEAVLALTLTNGGSEPLEIGGLGLSMPMNQMFTGRTLPQVKPITYTCTCLHTISYILHMPVHMHIHMHIHMHMHIQVARRCSFTEVYIGGDAGYVAVTRTTGEGPVLLALPLGAPGSGAGFEGWRPLKQEDRANYDWMHEMLYEVVLHSKAYAETEWRNAQPWVEPTSAILPGGGSATYGVRLRLAADVESIGTALLAAGSPVVVPLPGPTLHLDMTSARLQLLLPYGLAYEGAAAEPRGCVELGSVEHRSPLGPAGTNLQTVRLAPRLAGRCRVSLRYARGGTGAAGGAAPRRRLTQHVHLMLLPLHTERRPRA